MLIIIYSMKQQRSFKIWVDINIFDNDDLYLFKNKLYYSGFLSKNTTYSVLLKIKKGDIYYMLDVKQTAFIFNSYSDDEFERLFCKIQGRLSYIFQEYESELNYEGESVLLDFWSVEVPEELKISNLNVLNDYYSKNEIRDLKKESHLFGLEDRDKNIIPLKVSIKNNTIYIFDKEYLGIKEIYRFEDRFNKNIKENPSRFNVVEESIFYIRNIRNKNYIFVNQKLNDKKTLKKCFNLWGDLIYTVKDSILRDEILCRESGNKKIYFKRDKIILTEKNIDFKPVINYNSYKENWLPNSNIGVLDIETYEDNGINKCYALGFYTYKYGKCNIFYINDNFDSLSLIHNCFNEMFKNKYKDIIFYVHNLGKFDSIFLIKSLLSYNSTENGRDSPYILECHNRNSEILRLKIKRKIEGKIRKITLQDSIAIIPGNLRDLCKDYEVKYEKSYFPYTFCTRQTLFYKGNTPDISYYENIPVEEYNNLYKKDWSLKDECILYLEKDLLCLYELLVNVNNTMHLLYNVDMTKTLTISSLSLKIFLEKYYNVNKPIPLVLNKGIWDDLHKAYYGGRVEVFHTFMGKGYFYDVNSLYPFASLNSMPGLKSKYIESYNHKFDLDNLFGFFYCKIKSSGNFLGLLPLRTSKNLLFPVGSWYGWYFSEELKYAAKHGYEIEIIKGYEFEKVEGVFSDFVSKIYNIKNNYRNKSERNISKLILNSLYGKFGMYFLKGVTKLHDQEKHNLVSITRELRNSIQIEEGNYLDTYIPNIKKEICESFNVDFIKALNLDKVDEIKTNEAYKYVSLPVAIATLSYARIHMLEIMNYVLNNGGRVIYTDTDSIVTDIKLPEKFVDQDEIGKLKLEYTIKKGIFLKDKFYAIITNDDKTIKRAKGINSTTLSFKDYFKILNYKNTENAIKISTKRDFQKGSVNISKDVINIDPSYDKRERVFNNNGIIVGSKPIKVNFTKD